MPLFWLCTDIWLWVQSTRNCNCWACSGTETCDLEIKVAAEPSTSINPLMTKFLCVPPETAFVPWSRAWGPRDPNKETQFCFIRLRSIWLVREHTNHKADSLCWIFPSLCRRWKGIAFELCHLSGSQGRRLRGIAAVRKNGQDCHSVRTCYDSVNHRDMISNSFA